ncbi:MAG: hypothetical protein Q8R15_03760 [Candidatus Micrarchaeota archaeon]|nr:hypothetical protein [Candidatus Micrarchaeota archaeon]
MPVEFIRILHSVMPMRRVRFVHRIDPRDPLRNEQEFCLVPSKYKPTHQEVTSAVDLLQNKLREHGFQIIDRHLWGGDANYLDAVKGYVRYEIKYQHDGIRRNKLYLRVTPHSAPTIDDMLKPVDKAAIAAAIGSKHFG